MSDSAFFWRSYADLAAEPPVYLHKNGYAVLELGADCDLTMHAHTPADCDVLIRAAQAAKNLLEDYAAAQKPGEPGGAQ